MDAELAGAVAEAEEVSVVVEELSEDRVGTRIDLSFEMDEIILGAGCLLMCLWIAANSDAKFRKMFLDEGDEFIGVGEPAWDRPKLCLSLGGVTSKCHDVVGTCFLRFL
jgi:hypothetical protein